MLNVKFGVSQGSILGPLLFIININDLYLSTSLIDPMMFAGHTNLFYSHQDKKELRQVDNSELEKVCDWFNAKKLSLNEGGNETTTFICK